MNIPSCNMVRAQCDSVKGFFILLVFFSHFMQYVSQAGGRAINLYVGQLMVAPFFFYSGYGVMSSIKAKGAAYVRYMPRHRLFTTLINFDVAVLVFVLVDLALSRHLGVKQVLLSLVCWDSVGNSNWYIFVILLCYLSSYIVAVLFKKHIDLWTLFLCSGWMIGLSLVRPTWWYDTILCFPIGMMYAERKYLIESVCRRWYPLVLGLSVMFALALMHWNPRLLGFGWNLKAVFFVLSIALFTMKCPLRFVVFEWCGRHLFPLYMYQRIPMMILFTVDSIGFSNWRMPLYFVLSLAITVIIAAIYPKWQVKW